MIKNDKILILNRRAFRENDFIVNGLSPTGQCLTFVAPGAKKSIKRFGGGTLEPTHFVYILYEERKGRDDGAPMHVLKEAKLVEEFSLLRTDYDRLETALDLLNIVYSICRESSPEGRALFDLVGNALRACERVRNLKILRLHFQIKLLHQLGVLPQKEEFRVLLHTALEKSDVIDVTPEFARDMIYQTEQRIQAYKLGLST